MNLGLALAVLAGCAGAPPHREAPGQAPAPTSEPEEPNYGGECNTTRTTRCLPRASECAPSIPHIHANLELTGDASDHLSPAQTASHPGQCCYIAFSATACD